MSGASILSVSAVAGVVVVGVFWFGLGTPSTPAETRVAAPPFMPTSMISTPPSANLETITVHVAGEVLSPGLVLVDAGARIADAIVAAGGASPNADLSLVNLAAGLSDGSQVIVPRAGSPSQVASGVPEDEEAPVHVNTAGLEELMNLPGVGPVTARQILEHRASRGPFAVVEDLLGVAGIGEGKLAGMRDRVVIP